MTAFPFDKALSATSLAIGADRERAQLERHQRQLAKKRGNPRKPLCPECGVEPAVDGGRCFSCRGRSML